MFMHSSRLFTQRRHQFQTCSCTSIVFQHPTSCIHLSPVIHSSASLSILKFETNGDHIIDHFMCTLFCSEAATLPGLQQSVFAVYYFTILLGIYMLVTSLPCMRLKTMNPSTVEPLNKGHFENMQY